MTKVSLSPPPISASSGNRYRAVAIALPEAMLEAYQSIPVRHRGPSPEWRVLLDHRQAVELARRRPWREALSAPVMDRATRVWEQLRTASRR